MTSIPQGQFVPLWDGPVPFAQGDGPEDRPTLKLFLPAAAAPTAAVIVCPGGAYRGRAAHEADPVAQWLCSLGIAGLVVSYRVFPYHHPAPLCDAQRAIRMTRARAAQWNIDPARVGILGFSAGGHLACSAATIHEPVHTIASDPVDQFSSRPDALISCYAVVSFGTLRHTGSLKNLLGDPPDPAMIEHLSLEKRVSAATPPTFAWHTADDGSVPVGNTLLLAKALADHAVPQAVHIFPHGKHGLGLAPETPGVCRWPALCADWLTHLGWTAKATRD